jgi:hypothetical protein
MERRTVAQYEQKSIIRFGPMTTAGKNRQRLANQK